MRLKDIFARFRHRAALIASSSAMLALCSVSAFAAEGEITGPGSGGSNPLDAVMVTQDDLMPLFNGISSNMGVILKVGIPLFALFLVVGVIPKVIRHFTK